MKDIQCGNLHLVRDGGNKHKIRTSKLSSPVNKEGRGGGAHLSSATGGNERTLKIIWALHERRRSRLR